MQYARLLKPESGVLRRVHLALQICKTRIINTFDSASIPCGILSVRCVGGNVINQAIKNNRGVIILCSHFGPWFSVFKCLKFLKNIYVLGQQNHGLLFDDKFLSNDDIRNKVIELSNDSKNFSLLDAYYALKSGEIVGMAGDRMIENKRHTVTLLNQRVFLPLAPFQLAVRTDAIIVPAFSYKISAREILVSFCDAITPETSAKQMQLQYVRLLEENILSFPKEFFPPSDDWVNFAR